MTKRYKSEISAAVHETAKGLHKAGAIDAARMRTYDSMCLSKPVKAVASSRPSTVMSFEVFKDARGEWRWRLTAPNGRSIAASGEGYKNKKDCLSAIELVKHASVAEVGG